MAVCGAGHAQDRLAAPRMNPPALVLAAAPAEVRAVETRVLDAAPADPRDEPWPDPVRHLTLQLPGMSHHFDPPVDEHGNPLPGREFNERNWGIGIQLERELGGQWAHWVGKISFGLMKDSLDAMGAYAGHTWQKRVFDSDTVSVDVGGGAFLFYRTLRFDGPHVLVPGVLPVLSATHKAWGLGINVVAVPRVKFRGGTMPNVIYAQFTKAF